MGEWAIPLIVVGCVLFVLLLIGMMVVFGHYLSRASGWKALCERYAGKRPAVGTAFRATTVTMGSVTYRFLVDGSCGPEGLFLSMRFPYRPSHGDLLIPWSAIHHRRAGSFLASEWVTVDIGHPTCTTLQMSARMLDDRPQ